MNNWQPIDSLVLDGRQVLFKCPLGKFEAPALAPYEPTRKERLEAYRVDNEWPNAGWDATHWRDK